MTAPDDASAEDRHERTALGWGAAALVLPWLAVALFAACIHAPFAAELLFASSGALALAAPIAALVGVTRARRAPRATTRSIAALALSVAGLACCVLALALALWLFERSLGTSPHLV